MDYKQSHKDSELEKQIERGVFRDHYIIYCRKSTDEADSQKNSLNYQVKENFLFAERTHLAIAEISLPMFCKDGVVNEKHSGFKETNNVEISKSGSVQYQIERPKFQRLLWHLNKDHFKGIICLSWDRISRNTGDDTIIKKLRRKGVDFRFVYADYDDSSSGDLHMDIDGMFAAHHSRVTKEKVTATIRANREDGKCTYRAPIGYLNQGTVEHKPHDPKRAPIIKELFELYATGSWSISDLTRHAADQGLTSVPARKPRTKYEMLSDDGDASNMHEKVSRPLAVNRISYILKNQFYIGKVLGSDGAYVPSKSHDPIIDVATFERVQIMLKQKKVSTHYTEKAEHPFRGFIRCAQCQRIYTPYLKKGIVYYSARCAPGCLNKRKSVNFDFVSTKVAELLAEISLSDGELEQLNVRAKSEMMLLEEERQKEDRARERKEARVREDLTYLQANQLALLKTGVYTPESLSKERSELEAKLDDISNQQQVSEEVMQALVEDVIKISELQKALILLYENANPSEKSEISKKVISELFLDEKTLKFRPQIGFEPIFEAKIQLGAPNCRVSELFSDHDQLKIGVQKMSSILFSQ